MSIVRDFNEDSATVLTTIGICEFAVFGDEVFANLQRPNAALKSSYTIELGETLNIEVPHITVASGVDIGARLRLKEATVDFVTI